MSENGEKESKVVRMQKLRRAVGRLRNIRSSTEEQPARKQSWVARLKERLGLGGATKEDPNG